MNVFRQFNDSILEFVSKHPKLRPGTGAYSTPFRGTLFGSADANTVDATRRHTRVDVLWLGSNPNVPTSVHNILHGGADDFAGFEEQHRSDAYAEGAPSGRKPWTHHARGAGWATYRRALDRLAPAVSPDRVAFANILPWGSSVTKNFLEPLGKEDPTVVSEMVAFADQLNEEITLALRPRLILLPRSIAESRAFASTGLSVHRASMRWHEVPLTRGTFRFAVGTLQRGTQAWPVAVLPHPSSLKVDAASHRRVEDALYDQLGPAVTAETT